MLSGAGSPLYDILTTAQKSGSGQGKVTLNSDSNNDKPAERQGVSDARQIIADLIELSSAAQDSLSKSDKNTNRTDKAPEDDGFDFLKERLTQLKEEMDFIRSLLQGGAQPEQARVIGKQLQQIGENLDKIGRQLGLTAANATQSVIAESNLSIEAISLSYSFNSVAVAQGEDGSISVTSQSVNIELDFVRITADTQLTAVQQAGPGGQNIASDAVQARTLQQDYRVTAQTFKKILAEFEKNFTDRERLPLNLYNTIRNMIEKAVQGSDKAPQVDQVA
ncbi:MAG: hypothetical protein KKA05_05370 [Alphaproteobacteria bacterium]|nr:hypothetical protein [Alphaproteobacteria bacterium]MBU0858934.1 hypothetical protein [Alphaproteobacteria bacterium]